MNGRYEDKSTCTFYTKIGACRHAEKCSRKHIKPTSSYTILLPNLYQNPKLNKNNDSTTEFNPKQLQEYFDHFYEDIFIKFALIGEVVAMVVCENENNHLNGNVYVKFLEQESAFNAVIQLNQEWFSGRPVHCELSPVENFNDANCRAYDNDSCNRGDHCNFMHVRRPSSSLRSSLFKSQEKSILLKKLQLLNTKPENVQQGVSTEQEELDHDQNRETYDNESATPPSTTTVTTSVVEKLFAT
ncbi:uncharacterized protein PRCAT00003436001 [Priceomyces carsonii]|uniref:uncharacterized protein n=1 Tax=Priceomyces carsonii TaxID=28549 RepID=UPI002ED7753B|nr:unnamed protein product [Priceomyces carsonii]